jgi:hypothetical protein
MHEKDLRTPLCTNGPPCRRSGTRLILQSGVAVVLAVPQALLGFGSEVRLSCVFSFHQHVEVSSTVILKVFCLFLASGSSRLPPL